MKIYLRRGLVKVELGLARGKRLYDKAAGDCRADQRRETERDLKEKMQNY